MRTKLALIAVLSLVLLSGCAGLTTYEAPPAQTDEELASEYEYELTVSEEIEISEGLSISDYGQELTLTSWKTIYEKDISDELRLNDDTQSPIIYAVVNTPSVNIAGQEFNVLSQQNADNVVHFLSDETDENVEVHDKVDEFNTTHEYTGEDITISKYEATFTVNELGAEFEGHVLVSIVKLENSTALMFGSHPTVYDEEDNIIEMMKHTQIVEE